MVVAQGAAGSFRRYVTSMRNLAGAAVACHAGEERADVGDVRFTAEAEHPGDIDWCQRAVGVLPQGPANLIRYALRHWLVLPSGRSQLGHALVNLLLDRRALGVEPVEVVTQLPKSGREVENSLHVITHTSNYDMSASNHVNGTIKYRYDVTIRYAYTSVRCLYGMINCIDAIYQCFNALTSCTNAMIRCMRRTNRCTPATNRGAYPPVRRGALGQRCGSPRRRRSLSNSASPRSLA
jgi:hypothetical protein